MTPTGYTHLTQAEKERILQLRAEGYTLKQISLMTDRGGGTVRRVIYKDYLT